MTPNLRSHTQDFYPLPHHPLRPNNIPQRIRPMIKLLPRITRILLPHIRRHLAAKNPAARMHRHRATPFLSRANHDRTTFILSSTRGGEFLVGIDQLQSPPIFQHHRASCVSPSLEGRNDNRVIRNLSSKLGLTNVNLILTSNEPCPYFHSSIRRLRTTVRRQSQYRHGLRPHCLADR